MNIQKVDNQIEFLSNKADIKKAVGYNLYKAALVDKLGSYIKALPEERQHWTTEDLDKYIRNYVLEQILAKEFPQPVQKKHGRPFKIPSKKEIVVQIATLLNFPILAIDSLYENLEAFFLGDSTERFDSKDYIMTNILNQINQLDDLISEEESEKKLELFIAQKLKWMEFLAKLEKLTEKTGTQVFSVGGNMSVSSSTTVDKQLNISETDQNKVLLSLMRKYVPNTNQMKQANTTNEEPDSTAK